MGERLPCTQEVGGSIPPGSTTFARTLLQKNKLLIKDLVSLHSNQLGKNFLSLVSLFNNLDNKVFDVLKWVNTFMCLFISSVAFAQLLNICRLAQPDSVSWDPYAQKVYGERATRPISTGWLTARMFWVIWSSD